MEVYRTPDAAFEQLPDFPWEPAYAQVADPDGGTLRMAYVEAGPADGPVALLLHGEPSWSFLYRHVVRVLTDSGIRCVAPDLVGFGRSDKPVHQVDYSYARLVEWTRELVFDHLDLREVTPCRPGLGWTDRSPAGRRAPGSLRRGGRGQHRAADR
jgi:haloalkane dehalogenase